MLSICTTVKNRSRLQIGERKLELFPNCVCSLVQSVGEDIPCELVVADWNSDDWPLEQWLEEAARPIPTRIVKLDGNFSRGRGLNVAAKAARGDSVFFMDTDVLLCRELIRRGLQCVEQGKAYFPILYSFNDPDHRTGRWRRGGFGHCMLGTDAFRTLGGWPEYKSWGKEDDHFWSSVKAQLPVVREDVEGFYHQWHPDDLDFKNRYGQETEVTQRLRARAEASELADQALTHLGTILPLGSCYILVDNNQFETKGRPQDRVLPFLERNGQYWGNPTDDAQAIHELERMRLGGASFIVFAWNTFWWLDHYAEFAAYINSTASCILSDERLTIFEFLST